MFPGLGGKLGEHRAAIGAEVLVRLTPMFVGGLVFAAHAGSGASLLAPPLAGVGAGLFTARLTLPVLDAIPRVASGMRIDFALADAAGAPRGEPAPRTVRDARRLVLRAFARPPRLRATCLAGLVFALALAVGTEPPMSPRPRVDLRPALGERRFSACAHADGVLMSHVHTTSFGAEHRLRLPAFASFALDGNDLHHGAGVWRDVRGAVWAVRTLSGAEALFGRDGLRLDDGLGIRLARRFGVAPPLGLAGLLLLAASARRRRAERALVSATRMSLELGEGAEMVAAAGWLVPIGDVVLRDRERVLRLVAPIEWLGDPERAPTTGTKLLVQAGRTRPLGPRVGASVVERPAFLSDGSALAARRLVGRRTVLLHAAAVAAVALQVVVALALL